MVSVYAKNIKWDTSDYDPYLVDPCDANVPDLPEEVELDPSDNLSEEVVEKFLERVYGFSVLDFNLAVVSEPEEKSC